MSDDLQIKSAVAQPAAAATKAAATKSAAVGKKPSDKSLQIEVPSDPVYARTADGKAIQSWFNMPRLADPEVSLTDLVADLRHLEKILGDKEIATDKLGVTLHDDEVQTVHQSNIKKEQEIAAKLKKVSHESLWEKIIGWLSNAITLIAATIATVVTAGAAAPLLAAAILGTVVMILQETGAMKKIAAGMTKMFEDFGMSKTEAERAGAITTAVVTAVVMIVSTVVATVLSGGADSAGLAVTVYQVTKIVNDVAGAGLMITQGSLDIAQGVQQYQVADMRADQEKGQTILKDIDFLRGISQEDIKNVSQELQIIEKYITDALRDQAQSQQTTVRNMV